MAFLSLLTRDIEVERAVRRPLEHRHVVARLGGWERFLHTVRERPATCVIIDDGSLPTFRQPWVALSEFRGSFPSVPVVWLARPGADPFDLLRLGQAGVERLLLIPVDSIEQDIGEGVARALERGTEALVTRTLSPYLPPRSLAAVRRALDAVHRRPKADELAGWVGLSRPHLSMLLKSLGLPSVGHLVIWARLLHAGRWLTDPGRTAESVARQLDYSSGAAFRRALRSYVGETPTEVLERGGFSFVMARFLEECGMESAGRNGRTAA